MCNLNFWESLNFLGYIFNKYDFQPSIPLSYKKPSKMSLKAGHFLTFNFICYKWGKQLRAKLSQSYWIFSEKKHHPGSLLPVTILALQKSFKSVPSALINPAKCYKHASSLCYKIHTDTFERTDTRMIEQIEIG